MSNNCALMKPLDEYRCLKIAIVHDVAEGMQRRLVHTLPYQDRYMLKWRWSAQVLLPVLQVRVFGMVAAIVGDITPVDGVSDEDKHQMEAAAMARIRDMLGSDTAAGQQSIKPASICAADAAHTDMTASVSGQPALDVRPLQAKRWRSFGRSMRQPALRRRCSSKILTRCECLIVLRVTRRMGAHTIAETAAVSVQLEMILQAQEYEAAQGMQLDEFFDSTQNKWHTDTGRYGFTVTC